MFGLHGRHARDPVRLGLDVFELYERLDGLLGQRAQVYTEFRRGGLLGNGEWEMSEVTSPNRTPEEILEKLFEDTRDICLERTDEDDVILLRNLETLIQERLASKPTEAKDRTAPDCLCDDCVAYFKSLALNGTDPPVAVSGRIVISNVEFTGWRCPGCDTMWSPYVKHCERCQR